MYKLIKKKIKKKSGVYIIKNLDNNKLYIGSSENLDKRIKHHFFSLKNNFHANMSMQNDWNKSINKNFISKEIIHCDKNKLLMFEQLIMDYYKEKIGESLVYNKYPIAGSPILHKCSGDTKLKMRLARLGNKNSPYTRMMISIHHADIRGEKNPNYQRVFSDETKKRMSESAKKENIIQCQ